MKAAKRFEGLAKVVVFGLIVATFVFAPLGMVAQSSDGGSNGQPGVPPPDTTLHCPAIGDPGVVDGTLLDASVTLTLLRFVDF